MSTLLNETRWALTEFRISNLTQIKFNIFVLNDVLESKFKDIDLAATNLNVYNFSTTFINFTLHISSTIFRSCAKLAFKKNHLIRYFSDDYKNEEITYNLNASSWVQSFLQLLLYIQISRALVQRDYVEQQEVDRWLFDLAKPFFNDLFL